MPKIDLGKSVTTLANLGVLVGILLLVYELNQNRDMMAAQTRHDIAQGIVGQLAEIALNEELSALELRGRCGALNSQNDENRYFAFVNSRMRYWEDAHYQYRQGLYDESEFLKQKEAWRAFIRPRPTREYWNRMKQAFSVEFVTEVDALASEAGIADFDIPECP